MIRIFFLFFMTSTLRAETVQQMDEQFMRVMQMRAEENQQEQEFKEPKKPDMPKDRAVLGDRKAPIQVVEYSDFQCPYCQKGWETVNEVKKKYGKKMVFMFKHLPLPMHPMALPAAKRFEAIALQNAKKAYDFHDEVFKNQEKLAQGESYLDEAAKKIGANVAKMKKDMDGKVVLARIEADKAEAAKFGFSGTPGFLVSGVSVKGAYPAEHFAQIIDRRLASPATKAK